MAMTQKTQNMIAGSAVGGGGAIGLTGPVTNIAAFHLHLATLPPDVADDYRKVLAAIFAVALTVIGGWVARVMTKAQF